MDAGQQAVLARTDDDPAKAEALVRELEEILVQKGELVLPRSPPTCDACELSDHAKEKGVDVTKSALTGCVIGCSA